LICPFCAASHPLISVSGYILLSMSAVGAFRILLVVAVAFMVGGGKMLYN
jgi:hypothetical protein